VRIRVEDLCFSYGHHHVLGGIHLDEDSPGKLTALIGPNAAGKSTFLRCLAGLLRGRGTVHVGEHAVASLRAGERTKLVGYLPQDLPNTAALTVFEAVLVAHRQARPGWRVDDADVAAVSAVLERLGLGDLAARHLSELSGGQRQLVAVGQALAAEPRVLLLDEPTSSLDLRHQLDLLTLVSDLAVERQMTVVLAVHDLNLAARFAHRMLVLHAGRIAARGTPAEVLTPRLLREVYRVEARVLHDEDGEPLVVPLCSLDREEEYIG
jgi:iron complex transport system ATP-binding protein